MTNSYLVPGVLVSQIAARSAYREFAREAFSIYGQEDRPAHSLQYDAEITLSEANRALAHGQLLAHPRLGPILEDFHVTERSLETIARNFRRVITDNYSDLLDGFGAYLEDYEATAQNLLMHLEDFMFDQELRPRRQYRRSIPEELYDEEPSSDEELESLDAELAGLLEEKDRVRDSILGVAAVVGRLRQQLEAIELEKATLQRTIEEGNAALAAGKSTHGPMFSSFNVNAEAFAELLQDKENTGVTTFPELSFMDSAEEGSVDLIIRGLDATTAQEFKNSLRHILSSTLPTTGAKNARQRDFVALKRALVIASLVQLNKSIPIFFVVNTTTNEKYHQLGMNPSGYTFGQLIKVCEEAGVSSRVLVTTIDKNHNVNCVVKAQFGKETMEQIRLIEDHARRNDPDFEENAAILAADQRREELYASEIAQALTVSSPVPSKPRKRRSRKK